MHTPIPVPALCASESLRESLHVRPDDHPAIKPITAAIIDSSVKIHQDLGPGLLESVYQEVLAASLSRRGFEIRTEVPIAFEYEGLRIDHGFRVDILVAKRVVLEIKSVEALAPVHLKQLLTYLRLTELPVGLLLNFGAAVMKDGIRRVVNSDAGSRLQCDNHAT